MKVPFRQQASDFDCTPTSLINALSYLFNRRDLPPFVIHRIYKDSLDEECARGTSWRATQDLAFFLNNYKENRFKNFAVDSKYITGKQVHFKRNSKIARCLNSNGVAVICVHLNWGEWHSMLGFQSDGEWLYCYDPAPRTKRFIVNDAVQFIPTIKRHDPNLKIRLDWLDKDFSQTENSDERKYVFGDNDDRECLLLNRIHI